MLVNQLIKENSIFFTYKGFIEKYNLNTSVKEYNMIIKAIPNAILTLLNSSPNSITQTIIRSDIEINGINFLDKKFNNRIIREILNRKSTPVAVVKWASDFDVDWKKAWCTPHLFFYFQ